MKEETIEKAEYIKKMRYVEERANYLCRNGDDLSYSDALKLSHSEWKDKEENKKLSGRIGLRLGSDGLLKIMELRRKYPGNFDSNAQVVRSAINYYYNEKFKKGDTS
jgi:hypothetical protein